MGDGLLQCITQNPMCPEDAASERLCIDRDNFGQMSEFVCYSFILLARLRSLRGLAGFSGRATAIFRLIRRLLTVQLSKLERFSSMWTDYLYEDGWKMLCSLHERRSALIGKSNFSKYMAKCQGLPITATTRMLHLDFS
jgi:hypothetical protein